MMPTPPPPPHAVDAIEFSAPRDSARSTLNAGFGSKFPTGKLRKINFSKFEGDNPKLWQSRCKNYFEMYDVDTSFWVTVASMHFEDPVARWLQSVEHRIKTATWSELCS
jgi:hypothetical protein